MEGRPNKPPVPPQANIYTGEPVFEDGSKEKNKWLHEVQPFDIVSKGTVIMGKSAGQDDPMALHTDKYLVAIAIPSVVTKQLIDRNVMTHSVLTGSMRFTVPMPALKRGTTEAEMCSNFRDDKCNIEYVTMLHHTYKSIMQDYGHRTRLLVVSKNYTFPVFVPYRNGKIKWTSQNVYGKEYMEILGQEENNLVVLLLTGAIVFLVICMLKNNTHH